MIDAPEIRMIPVNGITVLNPRARNKRVFQELVTSIERLGLKKPITVSQRPGRARYDLVCGQGRLEAFIALGQEQIPAVVIEASEDDCYVMSLVENLARRQHTPLELVRAIGALRERGYSITDVAAMRAGINISGFISLTRPVTPGSARAGCEGRASV